MEFPIGFSFDETDSLTDVIFLKSIKNSIYFSSDDPPELTISRLRRHHRRQQKKFGRYDQNTLGAQFNLAAILQVHKHSEEALGYNTQVLEQFEKVDSPNNENLILALVLQAEILKTLSNYEGAKDCLLKLLSMQKSNAYSPWVSQSYIDNLQKMAHVWELCGEDQQALKYCIEAYEMISNTYGYHHEKMWQAQYKMSRILFRFGHLDEALQILKEALKSQVETVGVSSQQFIKTKSVFDWVLNFKKIQLNGGTFEIHDEGRVLPPATPEESALMFQNLGLINWKNGNHFEAEAYLKKCLELQMSIYKDKNHEEILKTKSHQAMLQAICGSALEARVRMASVIDEVTEVLGKESQELLICFSNLAAIDSLTGNYTWSYETSKNLLEMASTHLRSDDKFTLELKHNMICVSISLGLDTDQIMKDCRSLVDDRIRVLGPRHLDTLSTRCVLSTLYNMKGEHGPAIKILEQVYDIRKEMLGQKHLVTLTTCLDLTIIRVNQGYSLETATTDLSDIIMRFNSTVPKHHPEFIRANHTLAIFDKMQGKFTSAQELFDYLLRMRTDRFGWHHPETLTTLYELGDVLERRCEFAAATDIHRDVYYTRILVLGSNHPQVLESQRKIAWLMMSKFKKYRRMVWS